MRQWEARGSIRVSVRNQLSIFSVFVRVAEANVRIKNVSKLIIQMDVSFSLSRFFSMNTSQVQICCKLNMTDLILSPCLSFPLFPSKIRLFHFPNPKKQASFQAAKTLSYRAPFLFCFFLWLFFFFDLPPTPHLEKLWGSDWIMWRKLSLSRAGPGVVFPSFFPILFFY